MLDVKKEQKRKQNIRKFLLAAFIFLVLSLHYIFYIGNQFLLSFDIQTQSYEIEDYSYINSIKNVIGNTRSIYVLLLVIALIMLLLVYFFQSNRPEIAKIDTIKVTPEIEIPIAVGNGQYGNARFATEKEKKEFFGSVTIKKGSEDFPNIEGNAGMVIEAIENEKTETFYYMKGDCNSLFSGITRAGKNRNVIFKSIFFQMLLGNSMFVNDVKGENYYYTSQRAEKMGYKTYPLDFKDSNMGVHYNFLQPILNAYKEGDVAKSVERTWDLVSALVGETKGEAIWTNGETASIAAAILCLVTESPNEEYCNLTNAYYFIANMCKPDMYGRLPLNVYLEKLPITHPARTVFAQAELAPHKQRSSYFSMALGTLKLFTDPLTAEQTSKSDFNLEDLFKEKSILYLILPDYKKTKHPLATLFITQLYVAAMEYSEKHGDRLPIPFHVIFDETARCPTLPILEAGVTAGLSRGFCFHLFIQGYQQLKKKYKDDYETIIENCAIRMHLKGSGTETTEKISKDLGNYTVEATGASTSIGEDIKSKANYSSSSSMKERRLLYPEEVGLICKPNFLLMPTGSRPSIVKLEDLSKSYVNELYGMGDQAHNVELIKKRKSKRIKREVKEMIPVWKIWKTIKMDEEEEETETIEENVNEENHENIFI